MATAMMFATMAIVIAMSRLLLPQQPSRLQPPPQWPMQS
jgi:hypothetical protein